MANTVGEAVDLLNEEHMHPNGFHLFYVREELIKKGWSGVQNTCNVAQHLMQQTYDWRYRQPDKPLYSVELTAADMEYIGCAMEVYNTAINTRYVEPVLKKMIEKLGNKDAQT